MAPTVALAQDDPTAAQYDNPAEQLNDGVGGAGDGADAAPAPENSGLQREVVSGLPFTGLDVAALLAVALTLTAMGFMLRRLTFADDR